MSSLRTTNRRRAGALLLASATLAAASGCSPDPVSTFRPEAGAADAATEDAGSAADAATEHDTFVEPRDVVPIPTPDASSGGGTGDEVRVYAHTSSALFSVDPRTFAVTRVADFAFPRDGFDHQMTDIAINAEGDIWGITFEALYRVDRTTAGCRLVATFSGATTNGLSFVPNEAGGPETLIAADRSGTVYRVDTSTGRTTRIGSFGGGRMSSGDLVSVLGAGTFATVVSGGVEQLARIDVSTGAATLIGPTGESSTWGLGYWRGRIFGFTEEGSVVTIDITTGRATVVDSGGRAWWGAGVTTLAPTGPG